MTLNIFIATQFKGNSGIGIAIYKDKELKEKISENLGKKTSQEALYLTLLKALERVKTIGEDKVNFFTDSEILVKQLNNQYKINQDNIKAHYDKILEAINDLTVNYLLIPKTENKLAYELAEEGLKSNLNNNLKLNRAFFGKINCLKIQISNNNDIYFHIGLITKGEWVWEKVKMSDIEIGEMINLLKKNEGKCAFFHSYNNKKTQIWCNKNEKSFSIKIKDVSKNLSVGEYEVLRIILEKAILLSNFN